MYLILVRGRLIVIRFVVHGFRDDYSLSRDGHRDHAKEIIKPRNSVSGIGTSSVVLRSNGLVRFQKQQRAGF